VLHPDDAAWVVEAWLRAMAAATPFREEFRIRDREGEYRWVIAHAVATTGAGGAVECWYGTVVPVDERRAAEQALASLADRAAQRRTMLDRLGVAFTESLDFERTARTVVSAMCEDFADFAFVDVVGAEGRLQRVAVDSGRLSADPEPFRTFAPPPEAASHPINVVLVTGRTQIVSTCDEAWLRATTWSDAHYAFASALPMASIVYVPLIAAGERIGVLTFGAARGTGRSFTQADLEDAEEVARRAAVALANARLYRDLAASEARYRGIIDTAQEGVWIVDRDARTRYVNARLTEMLGYTPDEMYDRRIFEFMDPREHETALVALEKHRAGVGNSRESRLLHKDGHVVCVLLAASPIMDAAGAYTGSLGMFTDITQRKAIEAQRELVARATEVLSGSLELDALLGRFADLLVTDLAGEATIALHPDRAVVRRSAVLPAEAPRISVALRHRDVEVGSVTVRSATPFAPTDVALLDELASRAAVAIENAQLYEREHRVAATLQRTMLPAALPTVDGLTFDAVYYPGATEAEIGGDWYDAIALADGRVVVSIGDVTGRGLTAAVIMGRMRQAIEALATYESDPMRLLDAGDSVLRRTHADAIVTALVGVIDPVARTLTYATAGHPTPIVRAADGTIRQLPGRGMPLGLRDGRQPPPTSVVLPPASLVVFFTDGLVESTRDFLEGERRVLESLRDPQIADGRAPASALVARVLGGAVRDDVAVLTVRIGGAPTAARAWTLRWRFDPRDERRAHDVRDALAEALAFDGTVDVDAALLVFGELIGNAVRHTPGYVDVELSWEGDPAAPVLHVVDDGPGYAPQTELPALSAESGRGLYLVARLTREFSVTKLPDRGAHARAVLARRTPAQATEHAAASGKERTMDSDKQVVETKETTVEKRTVVEDVPKVPEPRKGETITIETHTEG
jgi:PAS domain S-box-containing protein